MRKTDDIEDTKPEKLSIDKQIPENLKTATFSMGCFWGPDSLFGSIEGVYRTRVGYTGGEKKNPTYKSLGSHTETVQIDFNPGEISYEDLLKIFWENHDYTTKRKRQYQSRIFFHDEEQQEIAEESMAENAATRLDQLRDFWIAEDYHQKYYLRQKPELINEIKKIYSPEELINSTAAARLNAVAGGKLEPEEAEEIFQELEIKKKKQNTT